MPSYTHPGGARAASAFPTRQLVLTSLFAALIAVGAFIQIPIPFLSFSLQTLFLALGCILLGRKWATISVLIYIAIGLAGFPIFTRGGGVGYVVQPSFGFLIGFVLWALITPTIVGKLKNRSVWHLFLAEFAGVVAMYAVALPYYAMIMAFYQNEPMATATLFTFCFLTTFPGDCLKSFLAAWMGNRIQKSVRMPS